MIKQLSAKTHEPGSTCVQCSTSLLVHPRCMTVILNDCRLATVVLRQNFISTHIVTCCSVTQGLSCATCSMVGMQAKYDVLLREGKLPGRRKASSWTSMKPKPPRRARGLRQPPTLSSLAEREHGDSSSEAPEQGQEDKGEGEGVKHDLMIVHQSASKQPQITNVMCLLPRWP